MLPLGQEKPPSSRLLPVVLRCIEKEHLLQNPVSPSGARTQTFHMFCYSIVAMILWGPVNQDSILISSYTKSLCKLKLHRPDVYLGGKCSL